MLSPELHFFGLGLKVSHRAAVNRVLVLMTFLQSRHQFLPAPKGLFPVDRQIVLIRPVDTTQWSEYRPPG